MSSDPNPSDSSFLANLARRQQRLTEDAARDLERMTPRARELVLARVPADPVTELQLQRALDYVRDPVSVDQFIYDDYYLGRSLKSSVFPAIVEDLIELFEGNYREVLLGGSWGWGKTREIEIAIGYEIYRLSCMRDPASALGLIPGSPLVFLNISVDVRQAERVLFGGLCELLKPSRYFREEFPFDRKLKSELRFLRSNIVCRPVAASEQAILGENVFSAALDEANFMDVVEKSKRSVPGDTGLYDQAQALADKLASRMQNRFNKRGQVPGHIYYASSARYPNDFTERKEQEAKTNPKIFVRRRAQWEVRSRSDYQAENFRVEVGDTTKRSRVLNGTETNITGKVIEVPMDFYQSFINDPDKAVRDLAGISVLSIEPFIGRREMIRRMFENGTALGMLPTFTNSVVTLQGTRGEIERLLPENFHSIAREKRDEYGQPMFADNRPVYEQVPFPALHYVHIDLSKTRDATGFVCAHVMGSKQVQRSDSNGKTVSERRPIICVDLALKIVPPRGGEIDIPKVRSLVYQLHDVGFEFGLITFDTFGSEESVKALKDQGYTSAVYSVDTDFTPWEELKQALYDERVVCYQFSELEQELAQLERTPKKIDHPVRGSKDIADCLAAVIHHCEEGWRKAEGSRGMFKF